MDSRAGSLLAITGITLLSGAVAYALYFDHKRRNDAEFRKMLRKDKKRADKSIAESKEAQQQEALASAAASGQPVNIEEVLEKIRTEEPPPTPELKEKYFMDCIARGEQLGLQGPEFYLAAAAEFYRALKVYPSPMELIVIYEKTVPAPVFELIVQMMNVDVKRRVQGYYEVFPPKNTKTRIEVRDGRKSVILTEDVPAGEIIYEEKPVVAVLDADLEESGEYCAHCFRSVEPEMAVIMTSNNPISSIFCSEVCLDANATQSHKLLFTTEPPLPPQMSPPMPAESQEARRQAQEKFVDYVKNEKRSVPLLVARFIARQVAVETSRLAQAERQPSDFTDADGGEYQLADHIERLRYVENHPASEERLTLVDVLRTALPGLEQFVTEEGHATVAGKLAYNAFGVCFGTGRDDKPAPTARPEDIERTRTPYGTSRQIGTAFYTLSCYLPHSCSPNARPSFDLGTNELQLIADRDLKKGDALSVAYVDVTRREDETIVECRRRRRIELARGWRFACQCSRCAEESSELSSEEKAAEADLKKDESVVDAVVRHEEDGSSTNAK